MLPLLCMSRVTALRKSSHYILYDLASRYAHSRVANLLPADQTTVDSLPQCLAMKFRSTVAASIRSRIVRRGRVNLSWQVYV